MVFYTVPFYVCVAIVIVLNPYIALTNSDMTNWPPEPYICPIHVSLCLPTAVNVVFVISPIIQTHS